MLVWHALEDCREEVVYLLFESEKDEHRFRAELYVEVDGFGGEDWADCGSEEIGADVVEKDQTLLGEDLHDEGVEESFGFWFNENVSVFLVHIQKRVDIILDKLLLVELFIK